MKTPNSTERRGKREDFTVLTLISEDREER
jgi:hypothetical protein